MFTFLIPFLENGVWRNTAAEQTHAAHEWSLVLVTGWTRRAFGSVTKKKYIYSVEIFLLGLAGGHLN